jgi:predicted nuclease of predicted toxin-antitoxin system
MRLLFDQNISFRITRKLQYYFQGCVHISDCNLSNSEDSDIWNFARKNDMAIVTFDSDFYDISIINGHPPKIIWIRTGNLATGELVKLFIDKQLIINSFLNSDDYEELACLELEM